MLKPLKQTLRYRETVLSEIYQQQQRAQEAVCAFLAERIPTMEGCGRPSVLYSSEQRRVTIVTAQKAVANEVLLRARELMERLRQLGIAVERLIVR